MLPRVRRAQRVLSPLEHVDLSVSRFSAVSIGATPVTPEPTVTPQPTVFADVCGECDVCLKISKDQCKTGGGHDTQSECEAKGANYVWCGPA